MSDPRLKPRNPTSDLPACINCKRRHRYVLIIQALVRDMQGYEVAASVPICKRCLRDDIPAMLALAAELRKA